MNARPPMQTNRHASGKPLGKLLAGLAKVTPRNERDIRGICLDSRRVNQNELFIAVPGENCDGRDYIREAVRNGAAAVAREKFHGAQSQSKDTDTSDTPVPSFDIAGLKKHIGVIADRFYNRPSSQMRVIGITGTNGKTTCAFLLAQALTQLGTRCALLSTIGSGFTDALVPAKLTTSDAIETHAQLAALLAQKAEAVCVEVSSHGLTQGRVNNVAFDVALLTNLSRDHLDYHHSMQRYASAKRKLFRFDGLDSVVLNADDAFGNRLLGEHTAARAFSYGSDKGDLRPREVSLNENGITFELEYESQQATIRSPLLGALNVSNLLAVVATLLACGYQLERIAAVIARCKSPDGRMELVRNNATQPAVVIDYAHTPDALTRALSSLRELCRGKLFVVFGCGGMRDRGKRAQMGKAAARAADQIIITDDNPRTESATDITDEILTGVPSAKKTNGAVTVINDRRNAIQTAIADASVDDIILIAGKGHETEQHIGASAFPFNDREVAAELLARGSDA